jgi:hypothetical protein
MLHLPTLVQGDDTKMFSLFPVPLKGSRLSVKLNTASSGIVGVELRNLIGKKLQEKGFPKGVDEVVFEDMDTYPSGVYVVLAKDGYGKIVEISKFIINK